LSARLVLRGGIPTIDVRRFHGSDSGVLCAHG
jgi:hypothetical protein